MSLSNSSLQSSGNPVVEQVQSVHKPEVMEDTKKKGSDNQRDQHIYELIETEAACTGPARVCTRWGRRANSRSGHKTPSLTQKISPTDNHLKMNI